MVVQGAKGVHLKCGTTDEKEVQVDDGIELLYREREREGDTPATMNHMVVVQGAKRLNLKCGTTEVEKVLEIVLIRERGCWVKTPPKLGTTEEQKVGGRREPRIVVVQGAKSRNKRTRSHRVPRQRGRLLF